MHARTHACTHAPTHAITVLKQPAIVYPVGAARSISGGDSMQGAPAVGTVQRLIQGRSGSPAASYGSPSHSGAGRRGMAAGARPHDQCVILGGEGTIIEGLWVRGEGEGRGHLEFGGN